MKTLKQIARECKPILKKSGVLKAGIFGSYATGKQKKRSDVDILIQFPKGKSYFDLVRLERQLKEKLNIKVDLLTYKSINNLIKKRILDEEIRIL